MKSRQHTAIWLAIAILFGAIMWLRTGLPLQALFFTATIVPVMVGTAYFHTRILIPRYLLAGRSRLFLLYSIYTLVVSLWLQLLMLILAFTLLAHYQYQAPLPQASDVFGLTAMVYLPALLLALFDFLKRLRTQQAQLANLQANLHRQQDTAIEIRVNRKQHRVPLADIRYIESRADYVHLHTVTQDTLVTKEKISHLAQRLPHTFLRIHRSFLVNTQHITHYTREQISLGEQTLPISRTYKTTALAQLQSTTN